MIYLYCKTMQETNFPINTKFLKEIIVHQLVSKNLRRNHRNEATILNRQTKYSCYYRENELANKSHGKKIDRFIIFSCYVIIFSPEWFFVIGQPHIYIFNTIKTQRFKINMEKVNKYELFLSCLFNCERRKILFSAQIYFTAQCIQPSKNECFKSKCVFFVFYFLNFFSDLQIF